MGTEEGRGVWCGHEKGARSSSGSSERQLKKVIGKKVIAQHGKMDFSVGFLPVEEERGGWRRSYARSSRRRRTGG